MKTFTYHKLFIGISILIFSACGSKLETSASLNKAEIPKEDYSIEVSTSNPCNSDYDLESRVKAAAQSLTGTPYSQANKTDCSGMFHKMLNILRKDCPDARLPTIDNSRHTRAIALWYYKNGDFKIIRNPAKKEELIQVGSVMFFGYQNRRNKYDLKKMNIDTLTTQGIGINHVAIVTSVKRVNGVLESYTMFHGRRPGKPASVTDSYRVTSWDKTWPMYGNAMQPWLAMAKPFGKE